MYVHHLALYCILFRRFLIPNQCTCSFAVDKAMIKESYYYYARKVDTR